MTEEKLDELAQRIDGVARVLMMLIADLEIREQLDGSRFCESVRREAAAHNLIPVSAYVVKEIADQLDEARRKRQSKDH